MELGLALLALGEVIVLCVALGLNSDRKLNIAELQKRCDWLEARWKALKHVMTRDEED